MQSFIQTIPDARGPLLSSFLLDNQTHLRPKSGLFLCSLMFFFAKKMPDLIHNKYAGVDLAIDVSLNTNVAAD